jgi:uncharacterized protein with HEPN domain
LTLPERDLGYLDDVRKYAARALLYTGGITFEQFQVDLAKTDAVIRCLTVIGEAAGRLSVAARERFPQFEWSAMTGMRHVLVHEYGRIDLVKVWDVVTGKLPQLHAELERYLGEIP